MTSKIIKIFEKSFGLREYDINFIAQVCYFENKFNETLGCEMIKIFEGNIIYSYISHNKNENTFPVYLLNTIFI